MTNGTPQQEAPVTKRNEHRITVWARGPHGVPVTCTCGWKAHAVTVMGAYAKKRTHAAEAAS